MANYYTFFFQQALIILKFFKLNYSIYYISYIFTVLLYLILLGRDVRFEFDPRARMLDRNYEGRNPISLPVSSESLIFLTFFIPK